MRRRTFLQGATAGALTFFFMTPVGAAPVEPTRPGTYPEDFNAYLKISADGRVGCFVGKTELGQGAMTVLAMLVAEELELDPAQVDMLLGDTDLCPWDLPTGGSLTMWHTAPVLRRRRRGGAGGAPGHGCQGPGRRDGGPGPEGWRHLGEGGPQAPHHLWRAGERPEDGAAPGQGQAQASLRMHRDRAPFPPQGRPRQDHRSRPVRR
ncbi:MAG: molybdopterin-dependent oxidoreductase [Holophagaceae bacterium]|uniref:Molybdopterin-dependent oxidoreductase n=1 Tax=Candidatus Geothrix skivensis TaxID=2954439 RepID=A0A9D7SG86_9BACT|nr:molybdopterin-dependent oxidoreductase [Candidatus Geothrix skivensis]